MALVSAEYPPESHGGIGSQTQLKAHGLSARGHEVHVICRSADCTRRDYAEGLVHVARVPGFADSMPIYSTPVDWMLYSAQVAANIWRLHAHAPLDLVEFPEWASEAYVHLLNRSTEYHIPTVVQLHGPLVMLAHTLDWPEPGSSFYQVATTMEKTCLELADAVFSSSHCSVQWCVERYGLPLGESPILHAGVDTGLFAPREVQKADRPTIIYVGKVSRTKGSDVLVEAACRLRARHPDLHLRMLGQGEQAFLKQLLARAAECGAPDLLELPGFVARTELPEHLARAHIFAAPSLYEGGPGFVYLEAMACGLPVVACNGSGIDPGIARANAGVFVPPGDVDALTAALGQLLGDPPARQALGQRARQYVLAEADSEQCLQRLEAFYITVARRASSAAGGHWRAP